MQEYYSVFFGKVFPERANVSIAPSMLSLKAEDAGIMGELKISISLSQITAVFKSEQTIADFYTLKNYIEDAIRLEVDALGYLLGCGYDIEITSMVDSLDNRIVFGVGVPILQKDSTSRVNKFDIVMQIYQNPKGDYLRRCLADLREAIRSPKDTGFFCYRGIESLRQYFLKESGAKNDGESWIKLRDKLNIDREHIEYIKQYADPVRHGDAIFVSDEDRGKILTIT